MDQQGIEVQRTYLGIFVAVTKALQANWRNILEECQQRRQLNTTSSMTLNGARPQEYIKIERNDNYYWMHKVCGRTFRNLGQLLPHVKSSCRPVKKPFLRASFSQNVFLSTGSTRTQSRANALMYLIYVKHGGVSTITTSHLNEILWLGAQTFQDRYKFLMLSPENVSFTFYCSGPNLQVKVSIPSNGLNEDLKYGLEFLKGIEQIFTAFVKFVDSELPFAVMTIGQQSIGIVKHRFRNAKIIDLFYPQATDKNGYVNFCEKAKNPKSCIKRFTYLPENLQLSIEDICSDVYANFYRPYFTRDSPASTCPFEITLLDISTL